MRPRDKNKHKYLNWTALTFVLALLQILTFEGN